MNFCEYIKDIKLSEFDVEDTDTLVVEINLDFDENKLNSTTTETSTVDNTVSNNNNESSSENKSPSITNNTENNNEDFAFNSSPHWLLDVKKADMKKTKCDWCNVYKLQRICCACKDVWYCSEVCRQRDKNYHENNCKKQFELEHSELNSFTNKAKKGLVGLSNLGNTCFMNTSLQCIANCYELSEYFLKDLYKKDINSDNPIGTQGVLAHSYATLVKNLYYGENSVFTPRNFKKAIATFQSMFTGYQQHDTQEFLNYLLDGLHEDLNRVLKKPFVDKDDSGGKDDTSKAKDQWVGFLRRNQSVLVDLLYGQYKSTITCPCSNISTTFDPFLSISLPLANRVKPYEVTCYFIFYDINLIPLHLNLMFNARTNIMALRNKVAKIMNIHPFSFIISKMDSKGHIDFYCNTRHNLQIPHHYLHDNQKAYFIFQIDPKLFNSNSQFALDTDMNNFNNDYENMIQYLDNNNSNIIKIIEEEKTEEIEIDKTFEETSHYYSTSNYNAKNSVEKAVIKYSNDHNYGFKNNFLITQFLQYAENESEYTKKSRLIFPRILYIDLSKQIEGLYEEVFDYYFNIICKVNDKNPKETDKKALFKELFADLLSNSNGSKKSINNTSVPFKLFINSHYHTRERNHSVPCVFDETNDDKEGYFFLDIATNANTKLEELVKKIPTNDKGEVVDNTFLFMNENKKFYSNLNNRDFYFLILWNEKYESAIKNLNDKHDYDFKITKILKNSIDLDECFKQFTKEEQLDEGNEWYCPSCKQHTRARVHMEIYNTPPVLIVHLKRFRNNNKIDTLVEFPTTDLDMKNYIIDNSLKNNKSEKEEIGYGNSTSDCTKYDLFAVAHHYGGMGGGHYVASAKNHFDNKWYNFNDSSVSTEKDKDDIVASSAYVLFYKRKDIGELNMESIYNKKFIDYEGLFKK